MKKLVSTLYKASRSVGKVASTANDVRHLKKTIETRDPSHIIKHIAKKSARKASHKQADKVANQINKLLK